MPDFASGSYDDTMVDDFSIDDKLIPSNTKKGKSDMSLMKNRPKEKSLALVPMNPERLSCQEIKGDSGDFESLKKMKNENAGLLKQPRVQK